MKSPAQLDILTDGQGLAHPREDSTRARECSEMPATEVERDKERSAYGVLTNPSGPPARTREAGAGVIDRPAIGYDDDAHAYTVDGEPVPGVSTIAKVAQNPNPLIAWAFKIGRYGEQHETPWNTRERARERGNAIHDALERLAQDDDVPDPERYPEDERGHVLSLIRWFLHYRPEFEAVELIVGSRLHKFAGRYDIRCRIEGLGLLLVDLKTSKAVYPDSHFPQLGGYELASVEMGFAPTDGQYVLNTNEDGSFDPVGDIEGRNGKPRLPDFCRSWLEPEAFLAYKACWHVVEGIAELDPREQFKRVQAQARRDLEDAIVASLPGTSRELAVHLDVPVDEVRKRLASLKNARRVACSGRTWECVTERRT